MVLNKRGGNKAKKGKNNKFKAGRNRKLQIKDKSDDTTELYGKVTKICGGYPPIIQVLCEDGVERRCVLRGKFIKKIWIRDGDIVLLESNKELASTLPEIYCKYEKNEVSKLEKMNEISNDTFEKEDDTNINNIVFKEETDPNEDFYSTFFNNTTDETLFNAFEDLEEEFDLSL